MGDTPERTPLGDLLSSMHTADGLSQVNIPDDWLQGRAVYGGLSTALCLQSTLAVLGDELPALRSVQVSFIGPAGGNVEVRPQIARQGKSTAFITADMHCEGQLAARATFCFAKARESRLSMRDLEAPAVPAVDQCGGFFEDRHGRNIGPDFAQHFNSRLASGSMVMSAAKEPEFTVWLQHKDPASRDSLVGLVAMADALPPAAMASFDKQAPVSSMTWMFDVLQEKPVTDNGWWLCRSSAESTVDGYSSQAMHIWNSDGEPVVVGRQNIAIFY